MRRLHIKLTILILAFTTGIFSNQTTFAVEKESTPTPNFVIIFADDMGYGDMGTFGHPTIKTPNLDRLAYEGQKWTNFYVAAPVCTPSRAGLMTGRLPIRSGMCSGKRRVLFPDSNGGLPENEITIASALKKAGYATACIGKWHLGHHSQYLPTSHGFDFYFGIPYSNDMDRVKEGNYMEMNTNPKIDYFNVPLMRNNKIVERPADQTTITKRYTQEAVKFIRQNKEKPFFIYLAHSMPHIPLFRSKDFENVSLRGIYGDVIQELDWSVGQVANALKETGLDENTIVVFTSDNGPWLVFREQGGSAGLLSGGKGGTYEGGMREPTIFWSPGKIQPGVVAELGTTMDLLPTFAKLANVQLPSDRVYDGYDIYPVLSGTGKSKRDVIFYYRGTEVFAVRKGAYKAHFITQPEYGSNEKTVQDPPLLYNLNVDPSEKYNIAEKHPEVIKEIKQVLAEHLKTVVAVENQLEK
ncbi:sulfatase-like hydrolase/transferase [Maribellus comscasis]|uniref:Sulfatase-like hydrolase/transferase n=1 Tax=Maribellus comscasis TaxID=2681766 RepID=A0A6I6K2E7_9BACT|nr:sulfatase [Maribellus comscasis]QGY44084.1 sulfatase-like hydrolase/transferase [Maribellus comscasis]